LSYYMWDAKSGIKVEELNRWYLWLL